MAVSAASAVAETPEMENARLTQEVAAAEASYEHFTQKVKLKLANLIAERTRVTQEAESLKAENEALEEKISQLSASNSSAALPAMSSEDAQEHTDLVQKIQLMETERKMVHQKIRAKLQQLVVEKHEAILRLRELEKQQIDPAELQRLRQEFASLLALKGKLTQKYSDKKTDLQNAKKWLAQNAKLRETIERLRGQRQELNTRQEGLREQLEESTRLAARIKSMREAQENNLEALAREKESQRHSALWAAQNKLLRNEVTKYTRENSRMQALVADKTSAQSASAGAESAELQRQLDASKTTNDELRVEIERVKKEAASIQGSISIVEGDIEREVAEKAAIQVRITSMTRKNTQIVDANIAIRGKIHKAYEERNKLVLDLEDMTARMRKAQESDHQNDELRLQLQELLDENTVLTERRYQLQEINKDRTNSITSDTTVTDAAPEDEEEEPAAPEAVEPSSTPSSGGLLGRMKSISRSLSNRTLSNADKEKRTQAQAAAAAAAAADPEVPPKTPDRPAGRRPANVNTPPPGSPSPAKEGKAPPSFQQAATDVRRGSTVVNNLKDTISKGKGAKALNTAELEIKLREQKQISVDDMLNMVQTAVENEIKTRGQAPQRSPFSESSDFVDSATLQFLKPEEYPQVLKQQGASRYPQVKCASLDRLVERLTYEKHPDMDFVQAFMLTYRSFTTPLDLLELLIQRYCIVPDVECSPAELELFKKDKQTPIRLRVFNVIKGWIDKYFSDFVDDAALVDQLRTFIDNTMPATGMGRPAETLRRLLDQQLQTAAEAKQKVVEVERLEVSAAPSFGSVLSFDIKVLAQQMCIIEHELYCRVPAHECLGKGWSKEDNKRRTPNIIRTIEHFNAMSSWVISEVVKAGAKPKDRAKVITAFIKLGLELKTLNNVNGVMEIVSGLCNSAITRMKKTWPLIDKKNAKELEDMKDLVANKHSYKKMRQHLHVAAPPCCPYLGIYLTDLTFIEDGNENYMQPGNLINFIKRQLTSRVIREIQQYQHETYHFDRRTDICAYLRDVPRMTEEEAYDMSLQIEPREK